MRAGGVCLNRDGTIETSEQWSLGYKSNNDMLPGGKMRFKEFVSLPLLDGVLISSDQLLFERLDEGKWVKGRFDSNIRIDQPAHGKGQIHAHVYGRKGNEIGVVNFDGSASHGTKCRLSDDDAAALCARGFTIKAGNIVEWVLLVHQPQLLLG